MYCTVYYCRKHEFSTTHISQISFVSVPSPVLPKKIANCGRPEIHISEEEADEIRFTLHLLLSQKLYPTTQRLLDHLIAFHPNFPVTSTTSLLRCMKKLSFRYKTSSKLEIRLDGIIFVAQCAYFFRNTNNLRRDDAKILFHDETWTNVGDERRSVWKNEEG